MFNLIKNEFKKIFKKKSMIVLFIITLGFVVLTNFIYHSFTDSEGNLKTEDIYTISYYEDEIKDLNLDDADDLIDYITYKTEIATLKLMEMYENNSWQVYIIRNTIYNTLYQINYYTYSKDKNDIELSKYKRIYNKQINNLNNGNFKVFIEEEIKNEEKILAEKELFLNKETNKNKIKSLSKEVEVSKLNIEKLKVRLEKNITGEDSYLNDALESYYSFKIDDLDYDENNASYEEKVNHNQSLSSMAINKYALDNKVNVISEGTSRGIIINFFREYEMIILVAIIMIAGAIVSEEFSKGTIKLLLIRPHSRSKILLSKLLSVILSIFIVFGVVVLLQLIVGGIFFGFDSLKLPAVIYNFNTNRIETLNVFSYLLLMFITILPRFILIATIAFAISTIFKNTALATMVGILGYTSSSIINYLVSSRDLKIFKYFITLNWNLENYLFGGLSEFKYVSLPFSIIICIIYFIIILIPTFIVFKKTNIKNT